MKESTIAAISTAYGEAGIGVVRISGEEALNIASRIFVSASGKKIKTFKPRYMYYGNIINPADGKVLDEVLCVYMKAPKSYTGEDVVEIQCHGSIVSLKQILALCLEQGAEAADRGEFTKRAFLNGRLDLSQAEAVIDLIKARTDKGFELAMDQMKGGLSGEIKKIRQNLLDQLVDLTVNMDYPDEDIEELTYDKLISALNNVKNKLSELLQHSNEGKILREGISIAIIGKPNVGKSSLLNIFLGEERSIVTDIPGTTRDIIEESADIRGIPVRFIDTAGIRKSSDVVEAIGIERSKNAFNNADVVMLLLDGSTSLNDEDRELLSLIKGRNALVVINKQDKAQITDSEEVYNICGLEAVKASFAEGRGIEDIKDKIENLVAGEGFKTEKNAVLSNVRHIDLVKKAVFELNEALNMAENMEALDFIEVNVRAAFDYLGEITGETASDQVINEVFSRFCLGK